MITQRRHILAGGALLIFMIACAFAWTVHVRSPWFGVLSRDGHQWQSAQTLLYTRNWHREGGWKLRWLQLDEPASIAYPTIAERKPYPSFPPGAPMSIYFISRLAGMEPSVPLIMAWNLFNHLAVTTLITLTCYIALLRLRWRVRDAAIASVVPTAVLLFSPAPMYWFQNVYYADEAVILPFALLIFLEIARPRHGALLQGIVCFWGMMTDWLFAPIIAVMVFRRRYGAIAGGAGAVALILMQTFSAGLMPLLMNRFMVRTGFNQTGQFLKGDFYNAFWSGHTARGYGQEAVWILWLALFITLVALLWRRRSRTLSRAAGWAALMTLPCFALPYLLQNHSRIHPYTSLKMGIPLAAGLVFIPVLLAAAARVNLAGFSRQGRLTLWLVPWLVLCAGVMAEPWGRMTSLFPQPDPLFEKVGLLLREKTGYTDLVFSEDLQIDTYAPQALAHSMRRVYPMQAMDEMMGRFPEARGWVLVDEGAGNWSLKRPVHQ